MSQTRKVEARIAGGRNLAVALLALGPGPVWFRPNPGNAGDLLLAEAARVLFADLGIRVRELCGEQTVPRGAPLVVGAGGNWVPWFSDAIPAIRRDLALAGPAVVLPQTVEGNEAFLGEIGEGVTLFCREPGSLSHARRHARCPVRFCEDLALYPDLPAWLRKHQLAVALRRWLRSARCRAGWGRGIRHPWEREFRLRAAERGQWQVACSRKLLALREDPESAGGVVPPGNLDISGHASFGLFPRRLRQEALWRWLRFLGRWDSIVTDRIHVAIAGASLGATVELFPGRYRKNQEMYVTSLQRRFNTITLRPHPSPAGDRFDEGAKIVGRSL